VNLLPGDVLLMGHQGSPIARCVRILSDSPWNHVGVVGPDGASVLHCPGQEDPVVVKTPVPDLPGLLNKPGYGSICITGYRHADHDVGYVAATRAQALFDEQPFEYSMGQNGILGALLWAQQTSHTVGLVLGAVLEQLAEVTEDVLSEKAINCTEFVWRCFDDMGYRIEFATPYYLRGDDERDQIDGIPQAMAPDSSAPGHQTHPHDTPVNRLVERIVRRGRRPPAAEIDEAIDERPPSSGYVGVRAPDDDVIPDLLVPRDFAQAAQFTQVVAWPRDSWPTA
jgi:hypothetical protein